ncbi:hypothetical protein BpHYR1_024173, partial [Brachionus plicatilis]
RYRGFSNSFTLLTHYSEFSIIETRLGNKNISLDNFVSYQFLRFVCFFQAIQSDFYRSKDLKNSGNKNLYKKSRVSIIVGLDNREFTYQIFFCCVYLKKRNSSSSINAVGNLGLQVVAHNQIKIIFFSAFL